MCALAFARPVMNPSRKVRVAEATIEVLRGIRVLCKIPYAGSCSYIARVDFWSKRAQRLRASLA